MSKFTVNGKAQSFDGDPETPLLWYLRDELGMTGTKFGCGIGAVRRLHGPSRRRRGALLQHAVGAVVGKKVTTIEGLRRDGAAPGPGGLARLEVPQCGYCQPGQIMQAAALLKRQAEARPTQDIDAAMTGNICRCGTYPRINAAIKQAAG